MSSDYKLNTVQMLDRLEVGQIAEGNTYWEVKRLPGEGVVELNTGKPVELIPAFMSEKWRILPNFISFEEAMRELKYGRKVRIHLKDGGSMVINSIYATLPQLCLQDYVDSKWSVEEEGNSYE